MSSKIVVNGDNGLGKPYAMLGFLLTDTFIYFFYCCTMHVVTIVSLIPNHQFTLIFKTLKKKHSMTRFHQDRNSRRTHTTDDNDIRPHTVQEHNKHTSTEINLVTAQSTAHEPPEDGRIYGPKHVRASFLKCFIVF
jgi:hypothetical protein